jgi:carbon starvation protein
MINKETDIRIIGYGAMMVECVISVVALIAACSLFPQDYFAINVSAEKFATLNMTTVNLAELSREVGEKVAGRPGGAVSLAVGFAQIFSGLPGMRQLMSYWYHFAIMFEALFILTTIDTGTRVARFLVQEYGGRIYKPLQKADWLPGSLFATGLVVFSWAYFIWSGSVATIWPMFGTANQLLSAVALTIATIALINAGKVRYIWATLIPQIFLTITTLYAGYLSVVNNYLPLSRQPGKFALGMIDTVLTLIIMFSVVVVIVESVRRAYKVLVLGKFTNAGKPVNLEQPGATLPEYGQA